MTEYMREMEPQEAVENCWKIRHWNSSKIVNFRVLRKFYYTN